MDAQPGRTVVALAGAQGSAVERVDGGAARCPKTEVQTRLLISRNRALGRYDPERDAIAPVPIADQGFRLPDALVSERLQGRIVEGLASVDVAHTNGNMGDHGPLPESSAWLWRGLGMRKRAGTATVSDGYYRGQRPATARTFAGAASQIASIETTLHAAAIQNAIE